MHGHINFWCVVGFVQFLSIFFVTAVFNIVAVGIGSWLSGDKTLQWSIWHELQILHGQMETDRIISYIV